MTFKCPTHMLNILTDEPVVECNYNGCKKQHTTGDLIDRLVQREADQYELIEIIKEMQSRTIRQAYMHQPNCDCLNCRADNLLSRLGA